ncbi:MAG: GNAT family N-acetyltransferase [Bdellovibrionales bacterium]|nr:GNAT family N-acetyltransferase [Bdellovibrionales bacterium]
MTTQSDFKEICETERLQVRSFVDGDIDFLISLMSDAQTMKYTGFKKPQALEKIHELHQKWKAQGQANLGVWAVEIKDPREAFGWVMLQDTGKAFPELGYMIHKSSWGRGYATELAQGMLKYAHQKLGLSKVMAECSAQNLASRKVLEKAGMSLVETDQSEAESVQYQVSFS